MSVAVFLAIAAAIVAPGSLASNSDAAWRIISLKAEWKQITIRRQVSVRQVVRALGEDGQRKGRGPRRLWMDGICFKDDAPCRDEGRGHLGELELQVLVIADGPPELLPLADVRHGPLQARLRL